MIATQTALDALLDTLSGESELAIDCEMDAMFAYRTSLCVVQIGWPGGEALIDAMPDLDRSGLGRLFADPGIRKVLHGGENDVGLMAAHWGIRFNNLFDTMAASQVLGHEGVSLAALLERHFELRISKKFQKADWRVRPLPEAQAEYARIDVRYLIRLRQILDEELQELDRVEEAESEFQRIASARLEERPFEPDRWVRVKGARELPADRRGTLREVYAARDEIARLTDRAPYRVMHDSALIEMAKLQPSDEAGLRSLRGVSRHLTGEHAGRLLAAIAEGRELTDLALPRRPRPEPGGDAPLTPEETGLFDKLRAWRKRRAEKRGVQVARVATNALLVEITRARPASLEALARVSGMESWRVREYGEEMLGVLTKQAGR
ncbi:MAG: ribonuclease D [Planctomycetota bacterium]|jgi:ribonuclease D